MPSRNLEEGTEAETMHGGMLLGLLACSLTYLSYYSSGPTTQGCTSYRGMDFSYFILTVMKMSNRHAYRPV